MSPDVFNWWLVVLTVVFLIESSFVIYFVRWIMWRFNTAIHELMVEKRERDRDS